MWGRDSKSAKTLSQANLQFDYLRRQIVGIDTLFTTPFGDRLQVYGDYTASGRCLQFVEDKLREHQMLYANTHTQDDATGRRMSHLLADAEAIIKGSVNASDKHCIIACGDGATAGIYRLQQILGIALPPVTWSRLEDELKQFLSAADHQAFLEQLESHRPIVFVGPYEHHSNEISWRSGFASVVEVDLDAEGGIDLEHLERLLQEPQYQNRLRIGSFSAASNVTGMRSKVHQIARLLHRHDAIACFDYAASAPYVEIDMCPPGDEPGEDSSLDAIYVSPHKFLGGPGSSGILIFNERVYDRSLTPCIAGGGTVSYVNRQNQDFYVDIEEREKAGTPGILQTFKAALAFAVKDAIGTERIEAREDEMLQLAFSRWQSNPGIEVLGNPDPAKRVAIVSFNIKGPDERYLHPKFATALLNDLFGIQSRAGCACAGPYGHRLLGIDSAMSETYREAITRGVEGVKPGWCRIGFHYTMDDAEANYIIDAVEFVAARGHLFLPIYDFDLHSGLWTHKHTPVDSDGLVGDGLLSPAAAVTPPTDQTRVGSYANYLAQADALADQLSLQPAEPEQTLDADIEPLRFFTLRRGTRIQQIA
jgi:selenocysteine lyase/cysteine desulfurase